MGHIKFTKMQGIGNDYIYIDCLKYCPENLASLSREMSDRHFGIGGDGIILILPSSEADFKMRIFNADGSEARMCGNGSRCVAKYVFDNKLTDKLHLTLETLSGVKHLFLTLDDEGYVNFVTVDMGKPDFSSKNIPIDTDCDEIIDFPIATGCESLPIVNATSVSIGNPHTVIFVDDFVSVDIPSIGKAIEFNTLFPERTNVEFVKINSRNDITMRVWERGSGVTMACGTGACASVAAAVVNGLTDRKVTVHLDGGDLFIDYREDDQHILMTGPAEFVFSGTYISKTDNAHV